MWNIYFTNSASIWLPNVYQYYFEVILYDNVYDSVNRWPFVRIYQKINIKYSWNLLKDVMKCRCLSFESLNTKNISVYLETGKKNPRHTIGKFCGTSFLSFENVSRSYETFTIYGHKPARPGIVCCHDDDDCRAFSGTLHRRLRYKPVPVSVT